jgi:hypothetical protein
MGTGAGGTADVAVAAAVAAAAAAASCRDPVATAVPRGGSLVAAALPAARGALDECRLVGTDASDLSTLAGVRVGTIGATLRMQKHKTELQASKSGAPGESATYLKLEKPRFLFLEGLRGTSTAPVIAAAALADAPAVLASASVACAGSSTDRSTAGACSSAASTALGDEGGGFHLSAGPPSLSSYSSSSDDEFSGVAGGEPLLLTQLVLLIPLLPTLLAPDPPLLPARCLLLFTLLRGTSGRPSPGCRWIRSCSVHGHPLLKDNYQDRTGASRENEERRKA